MFKKKQKKNKNGTGSGLLVVRIDFSITDFSIIDFFRTDYRLKSIEEFRKIDITKSKPLLILTNYFQGQKPHVYI